ncbi:MAG: hypothetical protein COU85_00150 [Candidatus Portnoybacteria bacterium CG10_big_fil_rev_8_21_14_0_10_44_7]|uniref:Metallopeptidase family protein n=1 Tax=Candidatus Portnoybacteria bacterium CG10_big_fil_rev_8_21_14_0_10_44_7 TaxID=1974816 RepID=A0A2M8KJJ2_9BACT|nr:MAG: hypothetical protein COU85_00150 [Candidatus Portnoybacteria bacterium CG10_big_fil_rev_8_21_14_0_10_44_7]
MLKISQADFGELVNAGIAQIPERFLRRLENVAIVILVEPTARQLKKLCLGSEYELFGLYEGVPQTRRGPGYGQVLPDKITIFKNPILRSARNQAQIKEIVRETVWHEIAHHFGSDERGAGKAAKKR